MQREIKPGDKVYLMLNPTTVGCVEGLQKWNRQEFRVSKVVYASDRNWAGSAKGAVYFELDGCVSDRGVPYGVLREWIIPLWED